MQAQYFQLLGQDPQANILLRLEEGEGLGNLLGPCDAMVPCVEGNAVYDAIVAQHINVLDNDTKPPE